MDKKEIRNPRWDMGGVLSVDLPTESYGECGRPSCHQVGELGNGVCQKCWDKGAALRSKDKKKSFVLPNFDFLP